MSICVLYRYMYPSQCFLCQTLQFSVVVRKYFCGELLDLQVALGCDVGSYTSTALVSVFLLLHIRVLISGLKHSIRPVFYLTFRSPTLSFSSVNSVSKLITSAASNQVPWRFVYLRDRASTAAPRGLINYFSMQETFHLCYCSARTNMFLCSVKLQSSAMQVKASPRVFKRRLMHFFKASLRKFELFINWRNLKHVKRVSCNYGIRIIRLWMEVWRNFAKYSRTTDKG